MEVTLPTKLVFDSDEFDGYLVVDEEVAGEDWRSLLGDRTVVAEIPLLLLLLLVMEVEDVKANELLLESNVSFEVVGNANSWVCDLVRFLSTSVSTVLLVRSSIEFVVNRLVIRLILLFPLLWWLMIFVVVVGMIWSMVINCPWFSLATKYTFQSMVPSVSPIGSYMEEYDEHCWISGLWIGMWLSCRKMENYKSYIDRYRFRYYHCHCFSLFSYKQT